MIAFVLANLWWCVAGATVLTGAVIVAGKEVSDRRRRQSNSLSSLVDNATLNGFEKRN